MNILELLLASAQADLRLCLFWAETTGDPEWQRKAADARAQCEAFELALEHA